MFGVFCMGNEIGFLVDNLSGSSRRGRQAAAGALSKVALESPDALVSHIDAFVDALNRPESQTRWECLNVLTVLIAFDASSCAAAVPGAEAALFDEDSGLLRLAAMRFLCTLGSESKDMSVKVWPLIDEAIQCYHGDLEFPEMLNAVIHFSESEISLDVKSELASRMAFDAKNGKGALKRRAQQILDNTANN